MGTEQVQDGEGALGFLLGLQERGNDLSSNLFHPAVSWDLHSSGFNNVPIASRLFF